MSRTKIKNINVDWSTIKLNNPKETTDGSNGHLIENVLEDMGFPVDRSATTDLPGMEVKSKSLHSGADWSIGRMTYNDIAQTKWSNSSVKEKMQRQYQLTIAENPYDSSGIVTGAVVVDFTHHVIQAELETAYEDCRQQLITNGSSDHATVKSDISYFEYKVGNSYQFRIRHASMKKLVSMAHATSNSLFTFA
jgi:hypothetical protein